MPTNPDANNGNHQKEWEMSRATLQFFDDKLHDLRKYGFSFLTALLTAGSILTPVILSDTSTTVQYTVKLAVFVVTLMLITALHLFDVNYRIFQQAVLTRVLVLERELNLELSEVISDRHTSKKINQHVMSMYILFILGVALLGGVILRSNWIYIVCLEVFAGAALGLILWEDKFKLQYKYALEKNARKKFARKNDAPEDWAISSLECNTAKPVSITLTNLTLNTKKASIDDKAFLNLPDLTGKNFKIPDPPIIFLKDALVFEIISEEGQNHHSISAKDPIKIYESYTWILKKDDFGKAGVYEIRPRQRPFPLARKIIVRDD
jgi:hypothetical protein